MAQTLRYGSWPSPISASLVAAGGVGVGGPAARGDEVWWPELRPAEGGRVVLVRRRPGEAATDVLPAPWSARTRVHEYGGGAWWLGPAAVFFCAWDDQRLYRLDDGADEPVAITPEPPARHAWRYADGRVSPDGGWVACVREDHTVGGGQPSNEVVVLPVDGSSAPVVVATGADFVAAPRWSPDGGHLAWICWDHPRMPWDGTQLRVAAVRAVADGPPALGPPLTVAGGPEESVVGPDWTADGRLVFSTDRTGWWNLASWRPGADGMEAITDVAAEIGDPQWVFGQQAWVQLSDGRLAVAVTEAAVDHLAVVEADGSLRRLDTGHTAIDGLAATGSGAVVVAGASPTTTTTIDAVDPDTGTTTVVRPPDDVGVDPAWVSRPEPIEFAVGARTSHAFLYRPTGSQVEGPVGERPPLIVIGHGGPTAHTAAALSLKVQYWTSRGFAVVDVNYGGSTGFGRPYRRLLDDAWGIVDVEDCIAVARHLADTGVVDGDRMAIRGGSAGGFTVLAALTHPAGSAFAAGTSLYGVADLEALARDTHKFESRYLDGLIGPYPEGRAVYVERSPINHTDRLATPLLVLQGLEDEIVPPNQAEAIVAALAAKGVAHAYLAFEGEQHGFRRAENIERSLEAELWFYGRVFGFEPADRIEPVEGAVGLG